MLLLHAAFPTQEDGKPLHEQWRECELYYRHTSSLLDNYQWLKDEIQYPIVLCEVVTRCSWFLLEQGRFKASTAMAQQASVICEHAIRSSKHPGFSTHYMLYLQTHLYNVLSGIQLQQLAPDCGLALFTKIRDIRANNQRSGDTDYAKWLNFAELNRALALIAQGRAEEALAIYQSREDIETNRDFNLANISIFLYLLKRYDEASTYARIAIDVTRDVRGENSPSAAYPLFYLGSIYSHQGNLDEAFKALSKCLAIRQEKMPRHLDTGLTLHKLAVVVRQRGDLESSIRIFLEALEIIQSSEYHPGTACRTAFALAETCSQHGCYGYVLPTYHARGITLRSQIVDWETLGLGESSEEYDRFVGFQHR
ncbi:hypothetical protein LZ554_002978 [Drepanopeziza brunnea f. sp. 'monogermtubi']|nr:hypothetical protein LZ554_002978 [Drepanopeziza brunnea f. sp. 'monogermtubi']